MSLETLAELTEQEQDVLRHYAAKAEYLRGSLPRSLNLDAGRITAAALAAIIHEDQENRRAGAKRLRVSIGPERPRAPAGGKAGVQIHTGNKRTYRLSATDIDGNPVDVTDASAESSIPSIVAVTPGGSSGTFDVGDPEGAGLGSAEVTFRVGELSVVETVEIIAGDAVAITVSAGDEVPR